MAFMARQVSMQNFFVSRKDLKTTSDSVRRAQALVQSQVCVFPKRIDGACNVVEKASPRGFIDLVLPFPSGLVEFKNEVCPYSKSDIGSYVSVDDLIKEEF